MSAPSGGRPKCEDCSGTGACATCNGCGTRRAENVSDYSNIRNLQAENAELRKDAERLRGLEWVIADMQKWEDEAPRPDEWKMREWIGKLQSLIRSDAIKHYSVTDAALATSRSDSAPKGEPS